MKCVKEFRTILDEEIKLKLEGKFEEANKIRSKRLIAMKRAIQCSEGKCECKNGKSKI